MTNKRVKLDIAEIEHPELDAYLVAQSIAEQMERRISHKRAMKQAMLRAMKAGAKGCMIRCGGRFSGAEMARVETVREGRVPRHTLRAEIDYAHGEALTTFGRIGIKVWIHKGEHLPGANSAAEVDGFSEMAKELSLMLMPKRVKYRKVHRGRRRGMALPGNQVSFGDFGLQALEPAWVSSRQIEAARRAIVRSVRRGGKLWIRVFPIML